MQNINITVSDNIHGALLKVIYAKPSTDDFLWRHETQVQITELMVNKVHLAAPVPAC